MSILKTKVLSEKEYNALKTKADGYDAIVASIVGTNEGLKPEDVTLETIQEVISASGSSDDNTEIDRLTAELATATSARDSLQTQVTTLTEENTQLRALPGAETVTTQNPSADGGAKDSDNEILTYATQNAGNTLAIVAKMKEIGYTPSKI